MSVPDGNTTLVTRDALAAAARVVSRSPHVIRTPLIAGCVHVPDSIARQHDSTLSAMDAIHAIDRARTHLSI